MKTLWALLLGCLVALGNAQAALYDRGNGMIYDDVLNVTWLQDANYAKSSGYSATGQMSWSEALNWASNLVFGGYDDWRLPVIANPNLGCTTYDGSTDCGYNIQSGNLNNELAYLFYASLGNSSNYTLIGDYQNRTAVSYGPFVNVDANRFWTGTPLPQFMGPNQAHTFDFDSGLKEWDLKVDPYYSNLAWAVRDGDVTSIPEPASIALLGLGLVGLGFSRRKQRVDN